MTHPSQFRLLGIQFLPLLGLAIALCLCAALASPASALASSPTLTSSKVANIALQDDTAASASSASKPSVSYQVHIRGVGWTNVGKNNAIVGSTGLSQRIDNLRITLDPGQYDGTIKYRVRLTTGKWKSWKSNGAEVGTYKNIEAVQVKITGSIAEKYDIVYRTHIQDVGWQRRMRNGEAAGTTGANLRIEALRAKLVAKKKAAGWINGDAGWSYYKAGKKTIGAFVDTAESPINETATGKRRYWLDSNGTLAVDRYVNPSEATDTNAGYLAYASPWGYLWCGKRATDRGITLADSEGRVYTETQWLKTSLFDGSEQRYRLQKSGMVATVKTGLFEINGKKYYGWEDGRGYLMRSQTWWLDGNWYKASSSGVLKNVDDQTTSHIDRYVNWAIQIANDDTHGYSQENRWGPDYDCSSLVVASLKAAGFPENNAVWTGNMKSELKKIGFVWHKGTKNLRRGDIMLVHNGNGQHTEIYIGDNQLVGAHSSENGGITGKTGDQTGREISVTGYYNFPWQGYLRYLS